MTFQGRHYRSKSYLSWGKVSLSRLMTIKAAHLNLYYFAMLFCEIALAFEWVYFQYVFM